MSSQTPLGGLRRLDVDSRQFHGSGKASTHVPLPATRWRTRIALPVAVLLASAAVLGYAARQVLLPAVDVQVVSVVTKLTDSTSAAPSAVRLMTVQAPGWIEPDPFAINVTSLADGVISEVLVLEGEQVEAGQVVARMIDADALIALQAADASLASRSAELEAAKAGVERAFAECQIQEALADELRDEVDRKAPLASDDTIPAGDYRRLQLRLAAQTARVSSARAAEAESAAKVEQTRAEVAMAQAQVAAAQLKLSRMEIRSPAAGRVLSRLAEPGSRMMLGGPEISAATVLRLYDPTRLQVRVDIPLADAAKVGVDQEAEVSTEALPGRSFVGRVSRLVHEANIQKNTVQVKVSILAPTPELKPEMLTKVRFFTSSGADAENRSDAIEPSLMNVFVPQQALVEEKDNQATAWVIDERSRQATLRQVELGDRVIGGWRETIQGLLPGDRVVIDPPAGLTAKTRLRVEAHEEHRGQGGVL